MSIAYNQKSEVGLIKFVIRWDQLCCYFYNRLCNSQMHIYYAFNNQTTDFETDYVFCIDNRLVLTVKCLFTKASTANEGG